MNTSVPRNMDAVGDGTRDAAATRPSGRSLGDWLDEVIVERAQNGGTDPDNRDGMRAIAQEMRDLAGRDDPTAGPRGAQSAMREAVAAIARRQADLDARGGAPAARPAAAPQDGPMPGPAPAPSAQLRDGSAPATAPSAQAGFRRAGIDLSSEVADTFARFSRELRDAINAADARPQVDELDRQMRSIGRAVDGLGANLPPAAAIAEIGQQTREMRDLLKAAVGRTPPLAAVERQVATLEGRLGRLAAVPGSAAPELAGTVAEVRALLEGFTPGAAFASLESRLDDLSSRIGRGIDAQDPSRLIEGLGRRVDEIHASLRSQVAESAVDTRPLESLVRGLSERIAQAREASADFKQLETVVRDAAAKIDVAAAEPAAARAVEAQFARLAERLDRSEMGFKALDGVEHSLGELFSQFEVTRQVAIDAAETAARTAARDTLRAALQSPGLVQRPADASADLADRIARGIEDLRAMQDLAERRSQATLSEIHDTMQRLAHRIAASGDVAPPAPVQPRRAAPDPSHVTLDPADMLIEPGLGRGQAGRAEPRFGADEPAAAQASAAAEGDGPGSFIAAARRAAQAAQASAASSAETRTRDRRTAAKAPKEGRPAPARSGSAGGALAQARSLLARRRRPILLALAGLVLLVGALEVAKLGLVAGDTPRAALASAAPARPAAPAPTDTADASAAGARPAPAAAPQEAPAVRPPLPTFLAGPAKPAAALDGIGEGLRALAASGDPSAQFEVGQRYADGRGVARDPKQAEAWFEKAAAGGSVPAEYRLGSAHEKGVGVDRDPSLAMAWYGKAADAGNIRAMHNLAVMAAEGAAGKPDYAKAAQWFGKASTFGVRDSQFNLAILYARGLGIEQSLSQSYTWFAIAAAGGDDDAAKKRDEVAAKLDPKALATAKAAADAFRATTPPAAANEVAAPAGGWDAAAPRAPAGAKVSQL